MKFTEDVLEKVVAEVLSQIKQVPSAGKPPPVANNKPPASSNFSAGGGTSPTYPKTSRAAVLLEKKKLVIQEYPVRPITDDEILVQVEGCGVCGTDVHEYNYDPMKLAPLVLGHEGTGTIVALGKNITRDNSGKIVKTGDRIVSSVMTCGRCEPCLYTPGRKNLCENMGVYGLIQDSPGNHLNGWFAEYILLRKDATFFQVNDINLNLRMLIEPAAVVVHALERAKGTGLLSFRSRVLIQGCGPIGLLMLAAVRAAGCQHVVALDGDDNRLHMAAKLGADNVINFKKYPDISQLEGAVKQVTKGSGAHFAFQCTGIPAAASNLFRFVRRGGGICEIGHFVDGGEAKFNPHLDICSKEISLVGSWVYTVEEYPIAYNFMRRAQGINLPVEDLITHRFPLHRLQEAIELNMSQQGLKVVYDASLN